jgi:hypothetical protein
MTEYRIKADGTTEDDLQDITLTQNANPFGDSVEFTLPSDGGAAFGRLRAGTPITVQSRQFGSGNSFSDQFDGFVVEPRPTDEAGAGGINVTAYALDLLLRQDTVTTSLAGQTVTNTLQQLIEDFTPVAWNASNVDVVKDVVVRRSFENERTDNILRILSRQSAGETFGVNDSREFYFRPAETGRVSGGIPAGDVLDYELPEQAGENVNEVRVFFDDGDRVVTVSDDENKEKLQESLNTTDPVTSAQTAMREDITKLSDAIAVGEEILAGRATARQIEVVAPARPRLLSASPGDVVEIVIPGEQLRDEYRIAQLEYTIDGNVTVTAIREEDVSQKARDRQSDMLVRHSDTLERVELRPAGRSTDDNPPEDIRLLEGAVGGVIADDATTVGDSTLDQHTVTNGGWTAFRDAWIDNSTLDIANVLVGTGDDAPSRDDASLESQSESASANVSVNADATLTVNGSPTTTDTIQEVGLELADGTLLWRGTLVEGDSGPDDVTVSLTVADDGDLDGVLTATGQTYARDILADNSPTYPDKLAVGDDDTAVTESDAALANQLASRDLGNEIVDSASDERSWQRLTAFAVGGDTGTTAIDSGDLTARQTAFVKDGADALITTSDTKYAGGEAALFDQTLGEITLSLTAVTDYNYINPTIAVRAEDLSSSAADELIFEVNDTRLGTTLDVSSGFGWETVPIPLSEIENSQQRITVTIVGGAQTSIEQTLVDLLVIYDAAEYDVSTWDNDNGDDGSHLSDPALYPDTNDVLLDAALDQQTDNLEVSSTWTATDNEQAISIEGNVTNNSTSASETGFTPTADPSVTLTISNTGTRTGATPTEGFEPQVVEDINIRTGVGGISAAGIRALEHATTIPPDVVNQDELAETGILDSSTTAMTRRTYAPTRIEDDQRVALRETVQWRMADSARPVDTTDLQPTITGFSEVDSDDTDNDSYLAVSITDLTTQ